MYIKLYIRAQKNCASYDNFDAVFIHFRDTPLALETFLTFELENAAAQHSVFLWRTTVSRLDSQYIFV